MLIQFLWFLALSSLTAEAAVDSSSPACPIRTRLDTKVGVLTSAIFHKANPSHKDPAQVSGFTITDFDSSAPWAIRSCGRKFCVTPKEITRLCSRGKAKRKAESALVAAKPVSLRRKAESKLRNLLMHHRA